MCPQQQQAWRMCVVMLLNSRRTKTAAVHAAVSNSQTYWPSTSTVRDGGDGRIYGRPISREFTYRQPPNVGNFTYEKFDLKLYLQEVKTRPRTLNFGGESWESPPVACRSEIIRTDKSRHTHRNVTRHTWWRTTHLSNVRRIVGHLFRNVCRILSTWYHTISINSATMFPFWIVRKMCDSPISYYIVTLYVHLAKILWLSRNLPFRAQVNLGL